jgi:hypothetical protein
LVAVIAIRVSHTTSLHWICACCTQASDHPVEQQLGSVLQTLAVQPAPVAGGWPAAHRSIGLALSSKQVPERGPECSL